MKKFEYLKNMLLEAFKGISIVLTDPFVGHYPHEKNMNIFMDTFLGCDPKEIENEALFHEYPIEARLDMEIVKETDCLKIYKAHVIPTKVVYNDEVLGNYTQDIYPVQDAEPMEIGFENLTDPEGLCGGNGLFVKKIDGCLALITNNPDEKHYIFQSENVKTTDITIILKKEDIGWVIQSIRPGDYSPEQMDEYLSKNGYKEEDYLFEGDVDNLSEWALKHVVHGDY